MKSLRDWLQKAFPGSAPEPARAERRSVDGLEAVHWTGSSPGLDIVKNISATGMYLVTRERWAEGEVNPIRLVYPELDEKNLDGEVTVETKAVRWGEDGMGLTFILPECMDLWLWKTDGIIEPKDILSEFRLSRALAFFRRICPSATLALKLLFREGLSNLRIASAVAIAHRAEIMLAAEPDLERLRAPESVVMRVVQEGSWAEDKITQQLWAGILVTACSLLGNDESNLPYIDLISEMATIDAHLFNEACTKSQKIFAPTGVVSAVPLMRTSQELIQIAGAHDLMKIDRNIFQLALLGLFEPRIKPKYFSFEQDANLTPTALGLEIFARCQGHRGTPHEYYSMHYTNGEQPSEQRAESTPSEKADH
jgi:hypothetical protein